MVLSLLKFVIGGWTTAAAEEPAGLFFISRTVSLYVLSLFIYFRRETKGYEDPKETDLGRTAGR